MSSHSPIVQILIAEDDRDLQIVMRLIIERMGYSPHIAGNGHQAVEFVKKQNFDVIFLDCDMPGLSGLEAAKVIRALPDFKARTAPIIAFTGQNDPPEPLATVFNEFLPKPSTTNDIRNVIEKYLPFSHRTQTRNQPEPQDTTLILPYVDLNAWAQLRQLNRAGQPDIVNDLIIQFNSGASTRLLRMQQAIETSKFSVLRSEAHQMKSISATIGAHEMSRICLVLEESAFIFSKEDLARILSKLNMVYESTRLQFSQALAA
ncbi:MAG: response regulator [Bdellovibrionota bacterium]